MTVFYDKLRKRWRYSFVLDRRRYVGYCVEPESGTLARNVTEARRYETFAKAKAAATKPAEPVLPEPGGAYTLAEAAAAYVQIACKHAAWGGIQRYIAEILERFGPATPVEDITAEQILSYRDWAMAQPKIQWHGGPWKKGASFRPYGRPKLRPGKTTRSPQTVNHYLKALRTILMRASKSIDPVTRKPRLLVVPRFEFVQVPKRMPRPLSHEEIAAVLPQLAPHVADALELCLNFGLRKKEALTLEVGDVDFSTGGIWLRGERTKAKRDEFLPGNDAGMALLRSLVDRARESGQARLVLYRKSEKCPLRPVNDIASGWLAACERAGLPKGRRFHDARAAYITAIAKSAPAPVVQDLARHRDFETTMRYIRLADDARRAAVIAMAGWRPFA
jgi:integrase